MNKKIAKKAINFITIFFVIFSISFSSFFSNYVLAAETVSNIQINPALDISVFSPYKIRAEVTGSPITVSASLSEINGEDASVWNYYVDGTPSSTTIVKNMSNLGGGIWETSNIYPDDIYPEIFFAPSNITWNNVPSNMSSWRRNYHLFKFQNSFTPSGDMSLWVEFNATPVNVNNSSDLQVYIVEKDVPLSYFTSDWRTKSQTELIATFNRNSGIHHTHSANSSHRLVTLSTNADGTVGTNNIDISDNFWVILYQDSTNVNRGWNLRYHDSSICQNTANWYMADRSGGNTWNTPVYQNGCPDVHIHLARRSGSYIDGLKTVINADYGGGTTAQTTQLFSFGELPNLPPNSTAFASPIGGSTYTGGDGETKTLNISWDQASDVNNDTVYYSILWLDENGSNYSPIRILTQNTESLSYNWNISDVDNGSYQLKGYACDALWNTSRDATWISDHCSVFNTQSSFAIQKVDPIYSLSNIQILSNNTNSGYAKVGDIVTLSFSSSGTIVPSVSFQSGGVSINNAPTHSNDGNNWTFQYVVNSGDTNGYVSFNISANNLDAVYSSTTNNSSVLAQVSGPGSVVASPVADTYNTPKNVSLSSTLSSQIRYTTNLSNPSCSSGNIYSSLISVSSPTTIKAIACDESGNSSSIATFIYNFTYTLTYVEGANGSITGTKVQTIAHGEDGTEVTAVADGGYSFDKWSDGVLTPARTDLNISSDKTVTAIFVQAAQYSLIYSAGTGGTITGDAIQVVNENANGTQVTAVANTGYTFTKWSDDVLTASRTDTNITEDKAVTAVFTIKQYSLSYVAGSNGSITGTTSQTINHGSNGNQVTAVPNAGYHFVKWSDNILTPSRTDLNVTENKTVTATFAIKQYTLSYTAGSNGSITGTTLQTINHGSNGTQVTAIANVGYSFVKWSDDVLTASRTDTNILVDKFVTATFAINEYTLTYIAGSGGTITGTTNQTVNYGSNGAQVTAVPNSMYRFLKWSDDSTSNPRTDSNIVSNINITAVFEYVPPRSGTSVSSQVTYLEEVGNQKQADELKQQFPHLFGTSQTEKQTLLDQYLAQLSILQNKLKQLQSQNNLPQMPLESCRKISDDLYFGLMNNSEVKCLQEFLKNKEKDIYPEGITSGNFLELTKNAVIRFQEKYSEEILKPAGFQRGTGYVGMYTRNKINQILND